MSDGYTTLALAVTGRALLDMAHTDPLVSLDALTWLVSEQAIFYLDCVGISYDPDDVFQIILGRMQNVKSSKNFIRGKRGPYAPRAKKIPPSS
jgi:hypothetical protein